MMGIRTFQLAASADRTIRGNPAVSWLTAGIGDE